MGTFEKLGILVIVVIIVMILAVAIYQWGGAGTPPTTTVVGPAGSELTVKTLDDLMGEGKAAKNVTPVSDDPGTWPGGIPRKYAIQRDDKVWVLVVKRWGLRDTFVQQIEQANPKIDFKRLKPGTEIAIPDPAPYMRTVAEKQAQPQKPKGAKLYEVKDGDTLESIAFLHLGSKLRWNEIRDMNPGIDPKRMSEGQEIYLPAK